jgi:tetratricopeptide (TPR) repeat protein
LEWCFGEHGDVELGIKLAAAAAPMFLTMSLLPECYRWSQRAIVALDDSTRSDIEEMQLQASLGAASMHMHGPNEPARAALNRCLEIAEVRGIVLSQVAMLRTLSLFSTRQGKFKIALEHANRVRAVVGTIEEPNVSAMAQSALGSFMGLLLHFMGDHTGARSELEAALKHWSPGLDVGLDDRKLIGLSLARILWVQGFPAKAVELARQTLNKTKLSSNPASLAIILSWVPGIFILVGDLRSAEELADRLIPHAESHSLDPYLHVGRAYKGALAICCGNASAGVETLQDSLKHLRTVHYEMRNTEFTIFLAQGLMAIGRVDEGIAVIEQTIRRIEENGELYFLPEALRLKACAILASQESGVDEAEACFIQSLELSRNQGARGWELRTAIDLARLWANRGKPEDGRTLLQPILEQFTEGRDTADPHTAEFLLAELGR